jgi:hypothetical protein
MDGMGRVSRWGAMARWVALVAGLLTLAAGIWAFAAPSSFYRSIATFPPYNRHFVHDLGAFQIGLGVTLLLALRWSDGLQVALAGFATAATVHFAGHVIDHNLGGHTATDLLGLGLLAAATLAAAVARAARP